MKLFKCDYGNYLAFVKARTMREAATNGRILSRTSVADVHDKLYECVDGEEQFYCAQGM